MDAALTEKAPAKINLTLRVVGRRPDGYHDLESLVAFADLADTVTLRPGGTVALDVTGPFAAAAGIAADNLILKAFAALRARYDDLRGGQFLLEKNIPAGAGLGGGSADAAAALRLLARTNSIGAGDTRLAASAPAIGADVPVCLDPRTRVMRGIGERLSQPVEVAELPVLLVNPGTALATRDVFSAFAPPPAGQETIGNVPREREALIAFLGAYENDLTRPAIACAPIVADVLAALHALPASRLVRMSGSGPTCFALFNSRDEAAAAARQIKAVHGEWWVHAGTLGGAAP